MDGNALKPYKNDLDYLDDQFKLIMLKVKTHEICDQVEDAKVREGPLLPNYISPTSVAICGLQ